MCTPQAFGISALQGEFVSVANAGGLDFHQNLALFRVGKVHVHDDKRLACGHANSGAGADGDGKPEVSPAA
jgi:hypothetical protein